MVQKAKVKAGVKKSFFKVDAPLTAAKISLYGGSVEEFEGRFITLDLTKSLRGRSLELRMKVKNEDGKLLAEPMSANLAGSYVRRSMRRGADYVEDSFKIECADAIVLIKPFLITRKKVSRAVRKSLRDNAQKFIKTYVKSRSTRELFSEIISNKLQRGMATKLKKIYPLAMCEIRIFEICGEKAGGSAGEIANGGSGSAGEKAEGFEEERVEEKRSGKKAKDEEKIIEEEIADRNEDAEEESVKKESKEE